MQTMRDSLYTTSSGSGPDLVLLHGWGMHSGVWDELATVLAKDYRVTLVDLPGHGCSPASIHTHNLDTLTQAVAAVTPAAAAWVGWSLGGLVAQRLAISHPERVSRLALIASSPCFVRRTDWSCALEKTVLQQFAQGLSEDYRATLKRFLALEVRGSDQAREQLRHLRTLVFQHGDPDPVALADGLAILEQTDLRPELARLNCPVLLLLGQQDQLVPVALGSALAEWLNDVRIHIVERAGHAPFFSHQYQCIEQLRAFL